MYRSELPTYVLTTKTMNQSLRNLLTNEMKKLCIFSAYIPTMYNKTWEREPNFMYCNNAKFALIHI
jgi:hypothetical protein